MVSTSRGILKYSTDRSSANEFDGTIATRIHRDERALVEMVRVNDRAIDVGKNLELIGHAQVVSVTGHAVGNHSLAHLLFRERINHVVLLRHAPESSGHSLS